MKIKVIVSAFILFISLPLFAEEKPLPSNVRIKKLSIDDRKSVNPPDFVIYQTKYKKGTQIRFDHRVHAKDYGLKCIECHHVEKCAHCHGEETTPMMVEESKIALHETCMGCHRAIESGPRKCDDCHKQVE